MPNWAPQSAQEIFTLRFKRTIALPPSAIIVLKEHYEKQKLERVMLGIQLKDDDLVFSHLDKPLRPNTVSRAWTMLAAHYGLKVIRLHDARYTHASLMLKQGVHPKIVQGRLGHASVSITLDTYSHVLPGLQEEAAIKFDQILSLENENLDTNVSKMLANGSGAECRPYRSRTCDTLIKSHVDISWIFKVFS